MPKRYLRIHPEDNAAIALVDLKQGEQIDLSGAQCVLRSDVSSKHKFALRTLAPGDTVVLYGIVIAKAVTQIRQGELLSTGNTHHDAGAFHARSKDYLWETPSVARWQQRRFLGFVRSDGQVGTRNYWLVMPLVF